VEAPQDDAPTSVDGQEDPAETTDSVGVAREWLIGDIVILKTKLKKDAGFQAQVVNVLPQKLEVRLSSGPMKGQTWRCAKETAVLLMKSTLDPTFTSQPEEEEVVNESQQHADGEVETKQSDADLAVDICGTDFEQDAV
jgi:hypothetical protein